MGKRERFGSLPFNDKLKNNKSINKLMMITGYKAYTLSTHEGSQRGKERDGDRRGQKIRNVREVCVGLGHCKNHFGFYYEKV